MDRFVRGGCRITIKLYLRTRVLWNIGQHIRSKIGGTICNKVKLKQQNKSKLVWGDRTDSLTTYLECAGSTANIHSYEEARRDRKAYFLANKKGRLYSRPDTILKKMFIEAVSSYWFVQIVFLLI